MRATMKTLSRRALVTGVTAAGATAAVGAKATAGTTPIARLWAEAEALRAELGAHRAAIAAAAANGGIPGWMRLGGAANRVGEARYARLVAILNTRAETAGDLAILGKVAMDEDVLSGARSWAAERLASASIALAA